MNVYVLHDVCHGLPGRIGQVGLEAIDVLAERVHFRTDLFEALPTDPRTPPGSFRGPA